MMSEWRGESLSTLKSEITRYCQKSKTMERKRHRSPRIPKAEDGSTFSALQTPSPRLPGYLSEEEMGLSLWSLVQLNKAGITGNDFPPQLNICIELLTPPKSH